MDTFNFFLDLGFKHIADITAYDHILFIIALCALYTFRDFKKVAILVTAFTVGHSIALAAATFQLVNISQALVEFLIPVSILLTCFYNVLFHKETTQHVNFRSTGMIYTYLLAVGFGLVHGLGFSNYLREMLAAEQALATPLFAFNLGLELGQLIIVACILGVSTLLQRYLNVEARAWNLFISGAVAGLAWVIAVSTFQAL